MPKVTLHKWQSEFTKWYPDCRVLVFFAETKEEKEEIKATRLQDRDFDVILTTFEVAMKEKAALTKFNFDYLILDEAHRIKNDQCVLSQVLRQFKASYRVLLTGTPLQNNL